MPPVTWDLVTAIVLVLHGSATLYMTGVIWMVQAVHYPLLACVPAADFAAFHRRVVARTTPVVGPAIMLEGLTAIALVVLAPPGITAVQHGAGLGLLLVLWLSTALVQVPCHRRLCGGFDADLHRRLVRSNWIRTLAWSLRALLVSTVGTGLVR